MGRLVILAVILLVQLLPTASFAQPPSPSPLDPEWRLVAKADWIVRARLEVPRDMLAEAIRTGKGEHCTLKLHIVEAIKGGLEPGLVECTYWAGGERYTPSPEAILALDGAVVLAFAYGSEKGKGYILQDKRAIRPDEPGWADRLALEVRNQRLIAEGFAGLPAAKPDEFEGAVKDLITKMLAKETQQEAVYEFQVLDKRAAPAIIRLMDDRRPLPVPHTQYRNTRPNAFEGIVHYSPQVALEALATVLGDLTDERFGQIYNGGSEAERRHVVDAWRTYLHYRMASEAASPGISAPPVPTKQLPAQLKP